ncbi:MAG TPA: DUF3604 domain-containing protein [Steroidobacteraceae bacterium]|nr:DUF3604 domain-containing protein [Steroidobacteraceae bacterium]
MTRTFIAEVTCAAVLSVFLSMPAAAEAPGEAATMAVNPLRNAYFGDLHLHTTYSLDAWIFYGTRVTPDDAYRFAKGETVQYLGQPVKRRQPLDFLAVTDHSENIGVMNELDDPDSTISHSDFGKSFAQALAPITQPDGSRNRLSQIQTGLPAMVRKFIGFGSADKKNRIPEPLQSSSAPTWQREIEAANHNYQPGRFTTFIAYEWSSAPNGSNLHRNIIFRGDTAPSPFTALDSQKPEDLWAWLEQIRKEGYEALAIPHNPNFSSGLMYDWVDSEGRPIDEAYAERRALNEPLSEIGQIKGVSETYPLLSPEDELANFEVLADPRVKGSQAGSYLRDALGRGLVLQRMVGANPFKLGFVGGSDLHSGLSVSAQADYGGSQGVVNLGGGQPTAQEAATLLGAGKFDLQFDLETSSGKLTGAWAESNTRESIYAALRRRETFATSGTELKFRFFGGWGLDTRLQHHKNWVAAAYAHGAPMGSDLPARPASAKAPRFAVWAVKDPNSGNLDRLQVIKVWEAGGQQHEEVFDVAWSGPRKIDPRTGKLPPVGDTVDLETGTYTNTIGAAELQAVWQDPQFDARQSAAYYLRTLEIPTPRWPTLLAIHHHLLLPKDMPATEQQRGWSSPIWYSAPGQPAGK